MHFIDNRLCVDIANWSMDLVGLLTIGSSKIKGLAMVTYVYSYQCSVAVNYSYLRYDQVTHLDTLCM